MDYFDRITGHPCANCEDEPARDDSLFCSAECRKEFEGLDEMSPEELRSHFFNEGRALGKDHAEAWDYAQACVKMINA